MLEEYLKDNANITVDDLLYMTNEDVKEMMPQYPKEEVDDANTLETKLYKESFEKITQEWKAEWFEVCMQRLADSEIASNYMMLRLIVGQQDHVSEYDKTTTLADLIFNMIEKSDDTYSKRQLQKLIGCAYSITIIKGDSLEHKEELLEESKKRLNRSISTKMDSK